MIHPGVAIRPARSLVDQQVINALLMKSALAAGVALASVVGTAGASSSTAAAPEPARDPIVFVHGLGGSAADWSTFGKWFEGDGYDSTPMFAVTLPSGQRNAQNAQVIKQAVEQLKADTGAAKIDIVAFSMGNLSSRYYLKNLGGTANVDDFAGIAGPNHGVNTQLTAMCAFGAFLAPDACETWSGSEFIRALNEGDETPRDVNYATWRSAADGVIVPSESTILEGADNRLVPGDLRHTDLIQDHGVYTEVRDFVR
ncbi:esterase/lipase family protein [Streptomyces boluensis]|uniref:Alpha/beta hydrolase n=1 Tax=Streptomyces boluensis TaxID=1775135 RepID=A0A964XP58_9ACTN|nr:alpha/beta hydrolase [Streptomyces boluensis]NBE54891.1 alpha/beta hydrolase [Streptomyces boluensis]